MRFFKKKISRNFKIVWIPDFMTFAVKKNILIAVIFSHERYKYTRVSRRSQENHHAKINQSGVTDLVEADFLTTIVRHKR